MTDFSPLEFLADFFDETDQHIQSVTRNLLALEAGERPERRDAMIDEMFRSFHSLKGLCGMVLLTPAADLGHAMESLLRSIKRGEIMISPPLVEALIRGTSMLEAVIATMRQPDTEVPDITGMLKTICELFPSTSCSIPQPVFSLSQPYKAPIHSTNGPSPLPFDAAPLPSELIVFLTDSERSHIRSATDPSGRCRSGAPWSDQSGGERRGRRRYRFVAPASRIRASRFPPVDWEPTGENYACIEVSDTGCGMDPRTFDPFFSTRFTGRGMGLPVVLGALKTHHGEVAVESEPGLGSVFRVFFPVSGESNAGSGDPAYNVNVAHNVASAHNVDVGRVPSRGARAGHLPSVGCVP
jgi:HPt (histidine-containing phosphotransfer) domain-containing protein